MARWIDAELLAKSYLNVAKEEHLTGLIFISPEDVAKTILKLSEEFEDVAPVVHAKKVLKYYAVDLGRYIPKEDIFLVNSTIKNIPFCGNCYEQLKVLRQKYCHNCGAKMDEE